MKALMDITYYIQPSDDLTCQSLNLIILENHHYNTIAHDIAHHHAHHNIHRRSSHSHRLIEMYTSYLVNTLFFGEYQLLLYSQNYSVFFLSFYLVCLLVGKEMLSHVYIFTGQVKPSGQPTNRSTYGQPTGRPTYR